MKTSMHRMIARHLVCFSSNASTLILMLISRGIQCFVSKWYLANHGAKDELKGATPIGITLQKFILYTLASFGSNYSPIIQIYAYVRTSNQTL